MSLWMLFILLPIRLGDLKKVTKVSLGWVIGGWRIGGGRLGFAYATRTSEWRRYI